LRYDPRYRAAVSAVREGRIGAVRLVHARRNSGRGATERYGTTTSLPWHVSVHDIDAILAATGSRVSEVTARATPAHPGSSGHWDALGALFTLDNDVPVILESAWVLPSAMRSAIDSRLEVVGADGVVEVAGLDEGLRVVDGGGFEFPDVLRYQDDAGAGPGGALVEELNHFVDVCRGGGDESAELERAIHVTEVVAALESSLAHGSTVTIGGTPPTQSTAPQRLNRPGHQGSSPCS
ncbi:MAG: Gfo/Idh/MocA family protein, partial [Nocardioidaceae bacterium]